MKPDIRHTDRYFGGYRPSWSGHNGDFINDVHEEIYKKTQHLRGWQAPGDSYKLFEMAYYAGDVILEVGTYSGRSAVVELLGAFSNPHRAEQPQYYGVDIALDAVLNTIEVLKIAGLEEHTLAWIPMAQFGPNICGRRQRKGAQC